MWLIAKWLFSLLSTIMNFIILHSPIACKGTLPYLLGFTFLSYLCTYVELESGKKWVFLPIGQGTVSD